MPPLRVLAKPWALLPLSGTLSALAAMALCLALVYTNTQATHQDAPLSRARPSPNAAAPVLLATAAYVCLYYAFLFGQSLVTGVAFYTMYGDEKRANPSAKPTITLFDVKYRNPPDAVILANRVVGNTLEQAFPFVVGLWLHAFYLSRDRAALLGCAYVASRIAYPFALTAKGFWIFASTMPGYAFIAALWVPVVTAAVGVEL